MSVCVRCLDLGTVVQHRSTRAPDNGRAVSPAGYITETYTVPCPDCGHRR
ncbi:hypothetical protein GCM10027294_32770 [Marinactinospora endophytica]